MPSKVKTMNRIIPLALAVFVNSISAYADPSSDPSSIKVAISVPKRCMFGDFDAIRQEMMWADRSKEQSLLVSLQSLDGSTEYVSELFSELKKANSPEEAKKVMKEILDSKYSVDLPILKPSDPRLFALSICKDSSGKKSCRRDSEGAFRDINEILMEYQDPKSGFTSGDSVYFYQIVGVGPSGVSVSKDAIYDAKKLKEFTTRSKIAEGAPDTILARASTLKSYPLEFKNNKLTVKLPVFDPVKCGQK